MGRIQNTLRVVATCSMALALAALGGRDAAAQFAPPPVTPDLPTYVVNSYLSAPGALFDLSTKFLRDNANQAPARGPGTFSPLGGGADLAPAAGGETAVRPTYRFWGEGYGLQTRTSAQNVFTGDERKTWGGIAGIGMALPSGWSYGLSVDQGHTKINVTGLPQTSTIDLTQIGGNVAYESGPWTFTWSGIYGFGDVSARRTDFGGVNVANYDAKLWGTIGEISYYWSQGTATSAWRVVPKIGLDFTHVSIDPFTESGGAIPVAASAQGTERFRGFIGAEVGYSWLVNKTIYDIAGYARAVDIFSQHVDPVLATATNNLALPRLVPGVIDDRFEFDAGISANVKLSNAVRLYAIYDGRFRDGFTSHAGTLGFEYRW